MLHTRNTFKHRPTIPQIKTIWWKYFYLHLTGPDGRFLISNVCINHTIYAFANIYGPNNNDPFFFCNFFSLIYNSTNPIIAGDFNTAINPIIDRSSTSGSSRNWHSTEVIKQYMDDYGLGDSWRMRNPSLREYCYYSSFHQSSSRIDFVSYKFLVAQCNPITIQFTQLSSAITHQSHY